MSRRRLDPTDTEPARQLAQALGNVPAEELRLLLACREHPPEWPPGLPWPVPRDLTVLSTDQLRLLIPALGAQYLYIHEALITKAFRVIDESFVEVIANAQWGRVELRQSAMSVGAHIRQSRRAVAQAQQARPPTPPEIPGGPDPDGATDL